MKLSEIGPCDGCGKKNLLPTFQVVKASLAISSPNAARSTLGLLTQFGGLDNPGALAIAEVMSPDPEVIKIAGEHDERLWQEAHLCMACAAPLLIAAETRSARLLERQRVRDQAKEEAQEGERR